MFSAWLRPGVCVLILSLAGCEDSAQTSLPSDEILTDIVYDLHLAEVSLIRVNIARQDSIAMVIRESVAASYGITPAQMDSWLEGLQRSPERLITVYDSVIARLEREVPQY
jgi:hypothetical protein